MPESLEAPQTEDQPVTDTPETPAPTADTVTPPENPEYFSDTFDPATLPDELRPAYQQMRGDYTKKTQTLAEQRRETEQHQWLIESLSSDDPQQRAAALRYLDIETILEDEDDDELEYDEDTGPDPALLARLEALEQHFQQQSETAQQTQIENAVNQYLDGELAEVKKLTGRTLNEKEEKLLLKVAFASPNGEDLPDVRGAYEELYGEFLPEQKKAWTQTKKTPGSPGKGQPGTQEFDDDNEQERVERMAAIIEARRSAA